MKEEKKFITRLGLFMQVISGLAAWTTALALLLNALLIALGLVERLDPSRAYWVETIGFTSLGLSLVSGMIYRYIEKKNDFDYIAGAIVLLSGVALMTVGGLIGLGVILPI